MTDALYDRLSRLLAKGHEQDANPPWRDWRPPPPTLQPA